MNWTAGSAGATGAAAGAAVAAGIGFALSGKSQHREAVTALAGVFGALVGGLTGGQLGHRAQFNRWTAQNGACGQQVADWATGACTSGCPDDSIPVNGQCPGIVPKKNLSTPVLAVGGVAAAGAAVAGLLAA